MTQECRIKLRQCVYMAIQDNTRTMIEDLESTFILLQLLDFAALHVHIKQQPKASIIPYQTRDCHVFVLYVMSCRDCISLLPMQYYLHFIQDHYKGLIKLALFFL